MTLALDAVLRDLHHGETALEKELLVVGERHSTDHEVAHVTRDLAAWSYANLERMAELSADYGGFLSHPGEPRQTGGPFAAVREKTADALGRRPEPGLLLLWDLRKLYLLASTNSVDWTMVGQAAQATRDQGLLEVAASCHPRTLRQIKWCNATIKTLSSQILSSV